MGKEIFSFRIVDISHYMNRPIYGLDPCFSEFRAKEIKSIPIIRIFGSASNGIKTCLHVHGVLPYFCIPYEGVSMESFDKFVYQLCENLDKALNVSLGQSASQMHHIFKVQLVKAFPYYGYHRREHLFLKIYMYNPRLLKRAANLLQNGALNGKTFQAFDAHVPYRLQFLIDYNLFPMSLLHVPMDLIKVRHADEISINISVEQILNKKIEKVSTSKLEIDINAADIINRIQLQNAVASKKLTNPGIESIWNDEAIRRKLLLQNDKNLQLPILEVPTPEERPGIKPSDSEIFYRSALERKLIECCSQTNDVTLDNTLLLSTSIDKEAEFNPSANKGKFNVTKLLKKSIYPDECTPDDDLLNATIVQDHLSGTSASKKQLPLEISAGNSNDDIFDEDTLDEEEILNLSQHPYKNLNLNNTILCEQGVIEFIKKLDQEENGDEFGIDLDSSLAPLSEICDKQKNNEVLEFLRHLDDEDEITLDQINNVSQKETDSEDECLNDFTIANEDIEEVLAKLSQTINLQAKDCIPQLDGADDDCYTPKKTRPTQNKLSPTKRSPRTPRSTKRHRYAPLQGIKMYSPKVSKSKHSSSESDAISASSDESYEPNRSRLKRKLKRNLLNKINSPSSKPITVSSQDKLIDDLVSVSSNDSFKLNKRLQARQKSNRKISEDLDKTEIKVTCNLRTFNQGKTEKSLKLQKCEIKLPKSNLNEQYSKTTTKLSTIQEKAKNNSNSSPKKPESVTKSILRKRFEKRRLQSNFLNSDTDQSTSSDYLSLMNIKKNEEKHESKAKQDNSKSSSKKYQLVRLQSNSLNSDSNQSTASDYLSLMNIKKNEKEKQASKGKQDNLRFNARRSQLKFLDSDTEQSNKSDNIALSELHNDDTRKPTIENPLSILSNVVKNLKDLELSLLNNGLNPNLMKNVTSSEINKNAEQDRLKRKITSKKDIKTLKIKTKKCRVNVKRLNKKRISSLLKHKRSTQEHNKNSNYIPLPGTSKTNQINKNKTPSQNLSKEVIKNIIENETEDDLKSHVSEEDEDDLNICSFYETSILINDSPNLFSETDSPIMPSNRISKNLSGRKIQKKLNSQSITSRKRSESMSPLQLSVDDMDDEDLIFTKNLSRSLKSSFNQPIEVSDNESKKASTVDEILQNVLVYDAPEVINTMPFYSNPDDVRKAKEVGNFTLRIPLQKKAVLNSENEKVITRSLITETQSILEKNENNIHASKNIELSDDEDSPIKIKRKKGAMVLSSEESLENKTLNSLSSPTISENGVTSNKITTHCNIKNTPNTPKSSRNCKVPLNRLHFRKDKKKAFQKNLFSDSSNESGQKSKEGRNTPKIKCIPLELLLSDDVQLEEALALKNTTLKKSPATQFVFSDLNMSITNRNKSSPNSDASFGLSGASLNNTYGFKTNLENLQHAKSDIDHNYLTTMSLEIFVKTRNNLYPNPAFDEICGIFYSILNDVPDEHEIPTKLSGYIMLVQSNDKNPKMTGVEGTVTIVNSEEELFDSLLKLVRYWDPDILAGYEIEMSSWGYILDRSKILKNNFIQLLSRVPSQKIYENLDDEEPKESYTDLDHESKIYGRILLDVWRLLRSEIALTSYTFENVMYHISHRRIPAHSYQKLTEWYSESQTKWIVLEYYLERVNGVMELLDRLDLIGRTCEMAKLIGIQFYEILSRGSQYRVESMMLRIAKPNNFIPMSPSPQQRLHMRAPEYLPLILEPQSRFYADPLIVLDFQSLYPSVMIAYNYCFSTCLGRVEHLGSSSPFEFGVSMLRVSPTMLRKLIAYDMVTISPCGAVFVKQTIREGVLPQMLREILDTRLMVKKSMKLHKNNQVLQRVLHSRQLALKLMANVTYGYTAANFSGRMPCVEVGDSVVAKGRETLERAIKLVEATPRWGVEVVYGDTDSLFVLCPGKTRETAFKIGEEIAEAVTNDNPYPVKLKLEKVYQPSILQTKKRYVGFMYENQDQTEPIYEAKGIETVRRDGCPAVAKILEKSLKILFETKDVSKVKQYVTRQFTKILQGKANVQDLIFAKEFRGRFGYKPSACVPALELTRKWMLIDPRKEPRRGERVPYIVTNGPPGLPIIRLVRCPHDVLNNEGLKINAIYYITRAIIPALNRCFLLIGADINEWFAELPRKNSQLLQFFNNSKNKYEKNTTTTKEKKTTISQYFASSNCVIDCGKQTKNEICNDCEKDSQNCVIKLQNKITKLDRAYYLTNKICQSCIGRTTNIDCKSLDCPVLFVKEVKSREYKQVEYFSQLIKKIK